MKILKFFITRIFFKRPILVISMITLLFIANYLTFTAARSIISTYQGYEEIGVLNKKGNYIANLDPNSEVKFDNIKKKQSKEVYEYIDKNYKYAFESDGFITSLKNKNDMEVSLNYINESSHDINQFKLSQGTDIDFDYDIKKDKIPVLIGAGLAKTYPVGSNIKVNDPATNKPMNMKVTGVLEKNTHRSNFYAPNSKNYFNFSIFTPINQDFIQNSNLDLQVNGLMEIVLLDTTKEKAMNLSKYIQDKIDVKFNFFNQQENFKYFEDYYVNSLKMISIITLCLLIVITIIAIWNTMMSIRLMIKDFTINLLVGLSYSKLRRIFYNYFGILISLNIVILLVITAFNRYGAWLRKDAIFATYGVFGLIGMDWIAIVFVTIIDIIIAIIIVEVSMRKIKKIPISLGVTE
ncbi:ABC transporter permease [Mammaliicoccus sciuri]|uniref:ABC transporter permease n=1 Tax=Mammaliicoccus sciuri TaxID=1296 RepID=UPI001E3C12A6|nr:ABC transporter permease [Mammaliicoccus sciuri]MCD8794992.1 ABC transporter permease [Mammaliicoccus sciuri]